MGAENGLNLTTANESQAIATQLAATSGQKSSTYHQEIITVNHRLA